MFHGDLSDWGAVSIGVPQGSILGPLLFALYINDLPSVVNYCILDLYADDAELHCSHSDLHVVETCLQSDLDAVATWLHSSRLCLNVGKSNCMLIGSHQKVADKTLHVSVGDNRLAQVNSVRYLGVLIDSVLSWSLHINNMVSRIRSRLAAIVRYGSLPPAVLCVLYSAFVMPLYDYCDVVWSPTTAKLNSLIERVHSKFLNKLPLSYHSKFSFTLTERRRFHTALQIFKSLYQISPPYLHNIFQFSKDMTGHVSRNINRLFVPRVFTNFGKRSFFY
ncbi:MAG: reverse transcriptase domain-containing protein [Acidobacteria bacterium]|nr:reverse transcriptase domain-containing protein [Acidobacteriota bacterium]